MSLAKKFIFKLTALAVMASGLLILAPTGSTRAATRTSCDDSVYEYCFGIGRNVNPDTCDCQGCLGLSASDCTEQGGYLDENSCTCVFPPPYRR